MKRIFSTLSLLLTIGTIAAAGQTSAQGGDYVAAPTDILAITVFGEPDMSGKFTVGPDGTFTFPQLGRLKAGGLTLQAIEQVLKAQLADGYLKNPQVAVALDASRAQRILIMGEVRSPGEYQLVGDTTLLTALVRAGGPTPLAAREVVIVRPPLKTASPSEAGGRYEAEILRVDLAALQAGNLTLNLPLHDGDTINVPKQQAVFLTGQAKGQGAYTVERGTTVMQLLSLAGGITDRGAEGRIRILRVVKGRKTEIKAKMNDTVEPGDTVVVPERFF